MTYSGDVTPGGPSAVRPLPGVVVRKASVSAMDNDVYLLTDPVTGEQLLVDAADDAPRLLALVVEGGRDGGSGLARIVTTHRHPDHHRALRELAAATGARTAAGRDDASHLPVAPDELLDHADVVRVGSVALEVVHLRGHTPGSVALLLRAGDGSTHLFSGDSLFPGGPGRTTRPEDFTSLMDDLEERVFAALPDDTWVYPGHGRDTRLGDERPHLDEWRARGW